MLYMTAIDAAKPRSKPYKLTDRDGLHLLVKTNGSKLWRYRYRFAGKELMLSLGSYPDVTLASARQRRDEARRLLADGKNPSQQRREDRIRAQTAARNSFGAIADELIEKFEEERKAPATIDKQKWFLQDLAGDLTFRPIAEVSAAEILVVLRKVEKRGHKETARRLRGAIGRVFRYAIATLRAEDDPTYALRGALSAPIVANRAAITDEEQLGELLRKIDDYEGRCPTLKAAMQFLVLTMARPCDHSERAALQR
jgi:hypothetical protein